MKLFKAALPLAIMLVASASCTLDEPSYPEGAASQMRLTAVTSYGVTLMKWDYDKQNRVTKISVGGDLTYWFTYAGDSDIPSTISGEAYDYRYDYETDKDVKVLDERWEWTDIKANSKGHITSYHCEETDDESGVMTLSGTVTLTYNSNGELTRMEDAYYDSGDQTNYVDVYNYTWQNGLLMSKQEEATDHVETIINEYSDLDNTSRQWDPNNEIFGPVATTGLFGVAPKKFTKSSSIYHGLDSAPDVIQYAYTLLPNGLIRMSKVKDEDELTVVMTYVYKKI